MPNPTLSRHTLAAAKQAAAVLGTGCSQATRGAGGALAGYGAGFDAGVKADMKSLDATRLNGASGGFKVPASVRMPEALPAQGPRSVVSDDAQGDVLNLPPLTSVAGLAYPSGRPQDPPGLRPAGKSCASSDTCVNRPVTEPRSAPA
jgi:hypothetical protein